MHVAQLRHVCPRDARRIDTQTMLANRVVRGPRRVNSFGNDDLKIGRVQPEGRHLPQAERWNAIGGEHNGEAEIGFDNCGRALVELRDATMCDGIFGEPAVVYAQDVDRDGKRRALRRFDFAADGKFDLFARRSCRCTFYGSGIGDADE